MYFGFIMYKINSIVFLFILESNLCIVKSSYSRDKVQVLADFFKIRRGPTHINAFLSWNKESLYAMSRMCSKEGIKWRLSKNESQFLDTPLDATVQFNIMNTDFDSTETILTQASKQGFLKKPYKWIIFETLTEIERHDFYLGIDSEFLVFEEYSDGYSITAIHKINERMETFIRTEIGTWNQKNGITNYKALSFYANRKDLNGSDFPLSFWASNPITYDTVGDYRHTHLDASIRNSYAITRLLTSSLNVNRTYIIHREKSYAGVLEDIKTGKAILGAMPLFFTDSRLKWIDYIAPNTMSHLYFIFRDPPLSYVANIFTRPFHRNVWYASFLMLVLIFAIKYVIVKWEWKEAIFRETIEKLHDATKPSVDDIAIVQMGVVSQQGSDTELKSIAGRIAFIFSLICFMFIYTAYSGMILALLQSTSNMITTLDDLLNSGIDLGIEDLMYAVPYFKSNNDPVKTAIYVKKLAPKGDKAIMTLEKGIEKMRTEFFAFHTEQNSAYKVVRDTFQENEKCNLQEIAYFNFIKPWIVATKNHTYKELLKIRLFHLKEVGFYSAERRRIFREKPECTSRTNSFVRVGISDIYPAFLFFTIGLMISLGLFLMEMILKTYLMRRN